MSDSIFLEIAYRICPAVAHREVEGQLLLLTPDDDVLYTLNGTGRFIWSLLTDGATSLEVAQRLAERYEISLDAAASDAHGFLLSLERQGILERVP